MPIQRVYLKYLDQKENSAICHSLCQKEDEKLLVTNRLLEILVADVEDLISSIECENGVAFDQHHPHARGEMSIENNQEEIQSINCKNIPGSAQLNLNIKEGHINWDNNHEDMLSKYCKAVLNSQQSDPRARGEISSENNQMDIQRTNCNNIPCSAQSNSSIKEGHIRCNNNHEDMLSRYCKAVLSSQQSNSCLKGQINFEKNQESLCVNTDFRIIPCCKQSDLSIKGQTNCENIQEDEGLLNIDSNIVSISKQPNSNIEEQIIFENSHENSLKIDCKSGFSSEQPDSNIKVQINCENDQENLTLKTDSKTISDSKQLNLRIKCGILCEYQDLKSLNEYFEDVIENEERNNLAFQVKSAEELLPTNKEKSRCSFKYIAEMINSLSMLCSFVGISLFSGIFFGLANVLEYRKIQLLSECAHYMVISAVVLYFLGLLLSFFQEDSKQNNSVIVHQTTVGETVLRGNSYCANVRTAKTLKTDKLKSNKSQIEVQQGTVTETSKPTIISSRAPNVDGISKHEEIRSKTVPSNIPKTPQHASTSNHKESKLNISSDISRENPQHAEASKQGKIAKTSASNNSYKSPQPAGSSKERESGRTLSSNSSSESPKHANTPKQRKKAKTPSKSPSLTKEPTSINKQLVPYQGNFENPSHGRPIPTVFSSPVPNFTSFMPTSPLENRPTEEIIATKKMKIFPGGVAQEEYRITRTAFYKCLWCPLGVNLDNPFCLAHRQSSEAVLGPNLNNSWNTGGSISSESISGQNNQLSSIGRISSGPLRTNFENPCYSGGWVSSESVLRSNLDRSRLSRGGISSQSALIPNLDSPRYSGSGISSQRGLRQSFDTPWCSGTRMAFENVSRPNLENHSYQQSMSSLVLHQPHPNQVSDVRTKFESMNILP